MSKLEEKLTASIKPDRPEQPTPQGSEAPRRSKPRSKPAPKAAAGDSDAAGDLNAPGAPLHPARIWPD